MADLANALLIDAAEFNPDFWTNLWDAWRGPLTHNKRFVRNNEHIDAYHQIAQNFLIMYGDIRRVHGEERARVMAEAIFHDRAPFELLPLRLPLAALLHYIDDDWLTMLVRTHATLVEDIPACVLKRMCYCGADGLAARQPFCDQHTPKT